MASNQLGDVDRVVACVDVGGRDRWVEPESARVGAAGSAPSSAVRRGGGRIRRADGVASVGGGAGAVAGRCADGPVRRAGDVPAVSLATAAAVFGIGLGDSLPAVVAAGAAAGVAGAAFVV